MLKRYKNALFLAAQEQGIDTSKFEIIESSAGTSEILTLKWGGSSLEFRVTHLTQYEDSFTCVYQRFIVYKRIEFPQQGFEKFDLILKRFRNWLQTDVKDCIEEETAHDLWAQARGQKALLEANPLEKGENSSFTEEEKAQIRFSLQDFKKLVEAEFQPDDEQKRMIEERLNYLTEAVDRLNRYDWKGVAVSTVIGIATTLTLDTQQGQVLWGLFKTAFRAAFQLMGGS